MFYYQWVGGKTVKSAFLKKTTDTRLVDFDMGTLDGHNNRAEMAPRRTTPS